MVNKSRINNNSDRGPEFWSNLAFRLAGLLMLVRILVLAYTQWPLGLKPYTIGELLINYDCGFVRRGLWGTFLLHFSAATGWPLKNLINASMAILIISLYGLCLWRSWSKPLLFLMIIATPFGLLFLTNDWNTVGRKDIFLLWGFYAFVFYLQQFRNRWQKMLLMAVSAIILMLLHESFLFLSVPLLSFIPALQSGDNRIHIRLWKFEWRVSRMTALAGAIALAVMVFIVVAHNAGLPQKMECLHQQYNGWLQQAGLPEKSFKRGRAPLEWLNKSAFYAFRTTSYIYRHAGSGSYWLFRMLLLGAILVVMAIVVCKPSKWLGSLQRRFYDWALLLGAVGFQLLIAWDWGRIGHILLMECAMIVMAMPDAWYQNRMQELGRRWIGLLLFLLLSSLVLVEHYYPEGVKRNFFQALTCHIINE